MRQEILVSSAFSGTANLGYDILLKLTTNRDGPVKSTVKVHKKVRDEKTEYYPTTERLR